MADPGSLILTAALTAASTALNMSRKIEGPRLDDLSVSVGDYGAPVPDVFGTRRLQPPVIWAEELREVKRRRKTKGGKYNDYTYFGTWAVALAMHEIDGVLRVWCDTHLVYDMTGAGPVTPFEFTTAGSGKGASAGTQVTDFMAIYLGTMTQEPDERMAASVEAEQGVGSCPAYHGVAYIVFKDVPLEKFGNRIPQVSVEFSSVTAGLEPLERVDFAAARGHVTFSYDRATALFASYDGVCLVDVGARAVMTDFEWNTNVDDNTDHFALLNDAITLSTNEFGVVQKSKSALTGAEATIATANVTGNGHSFSVIDGNGVEHWLFHATHASDTTLLLSGVEYSTVDLFGFNTYIDFLLVDQDGDAWMLGRKYADQTQVVFYNITNPRVMVVSGFASSGAPVAFHYADASVDHFVLAKGGDLFAVARSDGTIGATNLNPDYSGGITFDAFAAVAPGDQTFWIGFEELRSSDLTSVRVLDYRDWAGGATAQIATAYDRINHALVVPRGAYAHWCYLDRVNGAGVTLGAIAADRAAKVGVEDYDFTALDQVVQGWSVTQGQASSQLEPLFDAFDADPVPHEFSILGKKRSGTSGGTLETPDFVGGEPRYKATVRQPAELPLAITYNFADINADQQPNNVRSPRARDAVASRDERSIDMTTLASDADTMRGLAERHFRRVHGERREFELGLSRQQIALEPGDVRVLDLDGAELGARLIRTTISPGGTIETQWKYDHASFATLPAGSGAEMDGRPPTTVEVPLLSKGFFLDLPYIDDADARTPPSIYVLAAPFASGTWPGAVAYQAIDGEYSEELAGIASSSAATWGHANAALGDANPWLWDRLSVLAVTLQNGTLTGCTEAQADADPSRNLLLVGDELVQFTTATLISAGQWEISGLKRGRRGTEWACGSHVAGDPVVLLDQAQAVNLGLSEVGTNLSFKAITSGRTTGFAVDLEPFSGASLKPYAPCQLKAVQSGSDWVLSWVRRTRVGGAWTGGAAIPLGEASEVYKVRIYDGATLKRTFTSTEITENGNGGSVTYSSADQTTDFGAPLSSAPSWTAVQVSDAVGDGFVATYV